MSTIFLFYRFTVYTELSPITNVKFLQLLKNLYNSRVRVA
jgi:hypothetical protein